jgi:SWI/SNF-related matrix-associated actin-dependent regulator of chromatin subfamily A member 5
MFSLAEPLTEEEEAEKDELATHGFATWTKRMFQQFTNASAKHGRNEYELIAADIEGKDLEEVNEYAKVFWEKFTQIAGTYLCFSFQEGLRVS